MGWFKKSKTNVPPNQAAPIEYLGPWENDVDPAWRLLCMSANPHSVKKLFIVEIAAPRVSLVPTRDTIDEWEQLVRDATGDALVSILSWSVIWE